MKLFFIYLLTLVAVVLLLLLHQETLNHAYQRGYVNGKVAGEKAGFHAGVRYSGRVIHHIADSLRKAQAIKLRHVNGK